MRYFKVYRSFDKNDFVPIDETELDKAVYSFIQSDGAIFKNGGMSRIDSIMPDYHRAMGWNYSHILQTDDWAEIRSSGVEKNYNGAIGEAKEKVQYLIKTHQLYLLGKPVPGFEPKSEQIHSSGGIKSIAELIE